MPSAERPDRHEYPRGRGVSSLKRSTRETGDVVLLQEQVDPDARDHRDRDAGLEHAPVRTTEAGLGAGRREDQRKREDRRPAEQDQRAEELVPRRDEGEQRDGHDGRYDRRDEDRPEDLE